MTLDELIQKGKKAGKDAWWEARTAYYKGARAAGDAYDKAKREIPKGMRSLGDFVSESQKGMDFLKDNAPKARRNIEKMKRDLKKK